MISRVGSRESHSVHCYRIALLTHIQFAGNCKGQTRRNQSWKAEQAAWSWQKPWRCRAEHEDPDRAPQKGTLNNSATSTGRLKHGASTPKTSRQRATGQSTPQLWNTWDCALLVRALASGKREITAEIAVGLFFSLVHNPRRPPHPPRGSDCLNFTTQPSSTHGSHCKTFLFAVISPFNVLVPCLMLLIAHCRSHHG